MGKTIDSELAIRGLGDAAMTALGLHDRFGFCHAAVCLDDTGALRDLTVFTDPDLHTVDAALAWAAVTAHSDEQTRRVVLISCAQESVAEPNEADLVAFRAMHNAFEEDGIELSDWVRCDGDNVRSLAFTNGADAWPGNVSP